MNASIDYKLEELPLIAHQLLEAGKNYPLWTFTGEMGAGKTTLIKELGKALGTSDEISSPTYALVNEYHAPGKKIYHIDAFRISSTLEAIDAGLEDLIFSNEICWIEWPLKITDLLPQHYFEIHIYGNGSQRTIQYKQL